MGGGTEERERKRRKKTKGNQRERCGRDSQDFEQM